MNNLKSLRKEMINDLRDKKVIRVLQGFEGKGRMFSVKTNDGKTYTLQKINTVKKGIAYCSKGCFRLTDIVKVKQGERVVHL